MTTQDTNDELDDDPSGQIEEGAKLSDEWLAEIERRMDEFERNQGKTYSWPDVRDAATARLRK